LRASNGGATPIRPAATEKRGGPRAVVAACAAMAVVIVVRHLDNLGRLRRGTEPRFTLPKRQAPPDK